MDGTNKIVAYIAGPYRADTREGIERNIRLAAEVAKKYWKLGYIVICPHMNSAHFDVVPEERFLDGTIEILKRCDVIVMMKTWIHSDGALNELAEANEAGMPIIYDKDF